MIYETLLYDVDGAIATVTRNRPEQCNTFVPPVPNEFEDAIRRAAPCVSSPVVGRFVSC